MKKRQEVCTLNKSIRVFFSFTILFLFAVQGSALAESTLAQTQAEGNEILMEEISDEEQIIAIYRRRCDAMVNRDTAYLASVMGGEIRHITGRTQTLDEWLSDVEAERMKYYSIEIVDPQVTIEGDTAVLTCDTVLDARIYGARGVWTLPHVSHYVRTDGQWEQGR